MKRSTRVSQHFRCRKISSVALCFSTPTLIASRAVLTMSARKSSSNLNDPVIFRQTMTKTIAEKQIRGIRGGEIVDESSGRDIKGPRTGKTGNMRRRHVAWQSVPDTSRIFPTKYSRNGGSRRRPSLIGGKRVKSRKICDKRVHVNAARYARDNLRYAVVRCTLVWRSMCKVFPGASPIYRDSPK